MSYNMETKTITLSKTIKLPIEGIQYSNRVVSAEIEFEPAGFNKKKAWEEINQLIQIGQEGEDADWIKEK